VRDRLVTPPVHLTELVDATRDRLLEEDWDLAVNVTDLPLRLSRRPLLTHVSPTHSVALVSLPALGVLRRDTRLRETVVDAIGSVVGDPPRPEGPAPRRPHLRHRLVELGTDLDDDPNSQGVFFVARVLSGNLRLLMGMVRANHPWRLAQHLYRALVGAVAATVFALITSDVWRMADRISAPRLTLLALAAVTAAVTALIAAHDLWEHAPGPRVREQVMLFNLATLATVVLGVASLYAALFVAVLGAGAVLIDGSLFADVVDHPVGVSDYLGLAWLVSILATVGGGLGAALESNAAVREAAYVYLPEE
jgi:uncharacterized membrane protein